MKKIRKPGVKIRIAGDPEQLLGQLAAALGRQARDVARNCVRLGMVALAGAIHGQPPLQIVGFADALDVRGAVAGLAKAKAEWTRVLCSPATLQIVAQASGAPVLLSPDGEMLGELKMDGKPVTVAPWVAEGCALFVRELVRVNQAQPKPAASDEVAPAPSPIPPDEEPEDEADEEPRPPRLSVVREEPET